MAAVGAEVTGSYFLSSGVVGFFILLLLLSVYLTALCTNCNRRTFELQDPEDRNPSSLIRVVKLEEAMVVRENPMIDEIQKDEKDFTPGEDNTVSVPAWRSHLRAPQNSNDPQTNGSTTVTMPADSFLAREENSVPFTSWRSHWRAPPSTDVNNSAPADSDHAYTIIGGAQSSNREDAAVSSPPTNQEPGEEPGAHSAPVMDSHSVYARVSKKVRLTTPPVHTPAEVQVVEEEEEEEPSPALPDRKIQLEG